VSLSVQIGLLLAVATAFVSVIGFLYKHRGAVESPTVDWRRPVWSSLVLFRSRWYTLGIAIAMGSWCLHVGALALAPISLVQSVIAGGLVFLTVVADRLFGQTVTAREWAGVALAAAGLAFLAATLGDSGDSAQADYEPWALGAYVAACSALGAVVALAANRAQHHGGVLFGAAAGMLWAASDISIKALSGRLDDGLIAVLVHPLAVAVAVLSLTGLLVSARSLQLGGAVAVIAVTSIAANTLTIAAGPIVFGDPMPGDALGVAVRLLAFALVIGAAALTPAPVRAAQAEPV
jgi:hypothetical protein